MNIIYTFPPLPLPRPNAPAADPGHPDPIWEPLLAHFWFFGSSKRASNFASQKHRKNKENAGFWPPKIVPKPLQNRIKIDVPKNIEIFIDFWSISAPRCKSRTLIFVRMAIVLLGFYTIRAFAFGMRFGRQNHAKNHSKTRPGPFKNRCRKHVDFQYRFFENLASIWEGLGPPRWSQVGHVGPPKLLNSFFYPLTLQVF